ncbi:MAG: UvrD-helicase domain-containing protein, partial [Candidatus Eisenbacteria bacterium]|nr:UvrD-helicase domain-containing protein [Candidatus Eisenbacteria bacterium]
MSRPIRWDPAQRAAIETSGRDLMISAGAGTGKTTVLVERVVRKLRAKETSLDRLLLVTFTEKAAREMRERLYKVLAADPELRSYLPELPRAAISTIHGFCARLLRENFLEAGVDPAFRMVDERGQREARSEALRRVFHDAYRSPESGDEFRSLVEMAGYDADGERLRAVVLALSEAAAVSDDPDHYLARLEVGETEIVLEQLGWYRSFVELAWAEWRRAVALYADALDEGRSVTDPGRWTKHEAFLAALDSATSGDFDTPEAQERLHQRLAAAGCLKPEAKRMVFEVPRAVAGAKKGTAFEACVEAAKKLWASPLIAQLPLDRVRLVEEEARQRSALRLLAELTRELRRHYSAWKSRHGLLDFSDLELFAQRLLRDKGEALALADRYDEVLIDEYQDVNRLQESILSLIARPGRSFRVGDVKQSIYQFRQADPSLFRARVESSERLDEEAPPPPGETPLAIFLRRNHRSRPAILRAVNALFRGLFTPEVIGTAYAAQALEPARTGDPDRPAPDGYPVELHLLEAPPNATVDSRPAEREAAFVARHLPAWIAEENQRRDPAAPLRYAQVALLLRTRSSAAAFLEAFEQAGIPAALTESGSLLEERMVRDLRALLQVVANPRDDIALAAALRSPLFRWSDSDLARLRLARPAALNLIDALAAASGATSDGQVIPPGGDGERFLGAPAAMAARLGAELRARATAFILSLGAWRRAAEELSLPRLLLRLIEETEFRRFALQAGEEPDDWVHVDRLVDLAREYEEERGPSLGGFLARLDALEAGGGVPSARLRRGDADAVEILTVHKAKGLQYPIVIVPRLGWRFQDDRQLGSSVRIGKEAVGLRSLDARRWSRRDNLARVLLEHEARAAGTAEEARILYVALTRAEERLILVAERGANQRLDQPSTPALLEHRRRSARTALEWLLGGLPWPQAQIDSTERLLLRDLDWTAVLHPWTGEAERPEGAPPVADLGTLTTALAVALRRSRRPLPDSTALAEAQIRGKYWVTEFKQDADFVSREAEVEREASALWLPEREPAEGGRRLGTRFHIALSKLDLSRAAPTQLDAQFARFATAPWWEGERRATALERGFAHWIDTPLGRRLLQAQASGRVEREVAFSLRWPLARLLHFQPELAAALSQRSDAPTSSA